MAHPSDFNSHVESTINHRSAERSGGLYKHLDSIRPAPDSCGSTCNFTCLFQAHLVNWYQIRFRWMSKNTVDDLSPQSVSIPNWSGTVMTKSALIASSMGLTWDPPGADRTHVGPMLAPWTMLSGWIVYVNWTGPAPEWCHALQIPLKLNYEHMNIISLSTSKLRCFFRDQANVHNCNRERFLVDIIYF